MSINTSPLLTKFGFGYIALSGQQLKIVAKHVDFTANTIVDLVYEDPVRFAQTVMGMNADQEMDLSDAFMIVRNGSQHSQDPVAPCFEQAYQFVGNQIIQLNKRLLSNDK